jgi:hypothetical protein
MKPIVLNMLLAFWTLAFAKGDLINVNGALYRTEANGTWYYVGPTTANSTTQKVAKQQSKKQKTEAQKQQENWDWYYSLSPAQLLKVASQDLQSDFWRWVGSLSHESQGIILEHIGELEHLQAQAERDQVGEQIEWDLDQIEMTLSNIEMELSH